MRSGLFWIVSAARLIVGGLFLFSGWIKANDLTGFVYKLEEYFHVFSSFTPGFLQLIPQATTIAAAITLLELAFGILLLLGIWRSLTIWLLLLLIVFFTLLTGYSAITGAVSDCGCFGEVLKLTPWESFAKDVVLTLLILFLYLNQEDIRPLFGRKRKWAPVLAFGLAMLTLGIYTHYAYHHLPPVDFTAYAPGQDLRHNTTTRNAAGQIIAKDYTSWAVACAAQDTSGNTPTGNEFVGASLLIVLYDASDTAAIRQSADLARAVQARGILVYGGTSLLSNERAALTRDLNLPYCLAPQDQTMLKTMVRSSPGYLLLREGLVLDKWHKNDTPTAEQIAALVQPSAATPPGGGK